MKFSKYRNPSKKRHGVVKKHDSQYVAEMERQLNGLLVEAKTEQDKKYFRQAFDITMNS